MLAPSNDVFRQRPAPRRVRQAPRDPRARRSPACVSGPAPRSSYCSDTARPHLHTQAHLLEPIRVSQCLTGKAHDVCLAFSQQCLGLLKTVNPPAEITGVVKPASCIACRTSPRARYCDPKAPARLTNTLAYTHNHCGPYTDKPPTRPWVASRHQICRLATGSKIHPRPGKFGGKETGVAITPSRNDFIAQESAPNRIIIADRRPHRRIYLEGQPHALFPHRHIHQCGCLLQTKKTPSCRREHSAVQRRQTPPLALSLQPH